MKVTTTILLSAVMAVGWVAAIPAPAPVPQEPFYRESLEGGGQFQAPVVQYDKPTPHYHAQPVYSEPAMYNFQWEVNDDYHGNYYGHQEQREGAVTRGSYYIRLPDTRLMKVEYYADEYGYHPTITYEGEAQYPQVTPKNYQGHHNINSQRDLYL